MPKYLVTYHGGAAPTPDSMPAMTAAFAEWMTNHAAVIVDGGAPVTPAGQVAKARPRHWPAAGGYSTLDGSEDDVQPALRAHRFVARGGTLELNLAIDPTQYAQQD